MQRSGQAGVLEGLHPEYSLQSITSKISQGTDRLNGRSKSEVGSKNAFDCSLVRARGGLHEALAAEIGILAKLWNWFDSAGQWILSWQRKEKYEQQLPNMPVKCLVGQWCPLLIW